MLCPRRGQRQRAVAPYRDAYLVFPKWLPSSVAPSPSELPPRLWVADFAGPACVGTRPGTTRCGAIFPPEALEQVARVIQACRRRSGLVAGLRNLVAGP